jgi:hypothetical protein
VPQAWVAAIIRIDKKYPCRDDERVGVPMAKKAGRPKGSVAEERRSASVVLRLFADEHAAYKAAAKRDGLSTAAWMRNRLNKAAREDSE